MGSSKYGRPETWDDLKAYEREPVVVLRMERPKDPRVTASDWLGAAARVAHQVEELYDNLDELTWDVRYGTLEVSRPQTEDEQNAKLKSAQHTWDRENASLAPKNASAALLSTITPSEPVVVAKDDPALADPE